VDLPAPPLPLITAITVMARAVDPDPEHRVGTAPFHAISIRSRRRIRPFHGRSTPLNWIARSAQTSGNHIVQVGTTKPAVRKMRGEHRGEPVPASDTG